MRHIYFTFFLLFSLTSFSQDEILGEWFLYSTNINNIDYENIYEDNFNIIFHDPSVTPYNISGSGVCNIYSSNYNIIQPGEISTQDCVLTLVDCEGHLFESDHLFTIYCNYNNNNPEILQYEVVENGNNSTLIITNTTNNNYAVYGRLRLAISEFGLKKSIIKLKENPVKDQLEFVVENASFNNISYTIYSVEGKVISSNKTLVNNTVNLSNLSPGLYFIKMLTDDNQTQTLKFIKD